MMKSSKLEPAAMFHLLVFRWFRKVAQSVGLDLFKENYKPTTFTFLFISLLGLYELSGIYTIYYYEFEKKILCGSMYAFNNQGLVKYYGMIKNAKTIKYNAEFACKVYAANQNDSPNKMCLAKSVKITVKIFKTGLALLIVTGTTLACMPFILFPFNGQLETIIPAFLPGINEKEPIGYSILAVFHLVLCFIFVMGTAGVDLSLMTMVVHSLTMSRLFKNAVNDFNDKVKTKQNQFEIRASLNNLILLHIDFSKFMKNIKISYSEICLIQIMMANTSMCVLVYIILKMNWFPSYFLMATAFAQVLEYSLLGTFVEFANERVFNSIKHISFVGLPIAEQRKICLMTLMAQRPHNLTLGGFQELNITTFVSSMKTSYTIAMLLVRSEK